MRENRIFILFLALLAFGETAIADGIPDRYAIAPPLPVVPDYFSGFSVGMVGSFWGDHFEIEGRGIVVCDVLPVDNQPSCVHEGIPIVFSTEPAETLLLINNADSAERSGGIGIQLTLGKVFFNHYLLGFLENPVGNPLGLYLGFYGGGIFGEDHVNGKKVIRNPQLLSAITTDGTAVLNTQVGIENIYDVGLQLGIVLTRTMAYLKGGPAWSKLESTSHLGVHSIELDSFNESVTSINENKLGYEMGIGATQIFLNNFSISLEYMYRSFERVGAGTGPIIVPVELRNKDVVDPLFYQATETATWVDQSSIQAILAYHCHWLQ